MEGDGGKKGGRQGERDGERGRERGRECKEAEPKEKKRKTKNLLIH